MWRSSVKCGGLAVLKMRGSYHQKEIREFSIDGSGLRIGKPFRNIFGIISGNFHQLSPSDVKELEPLLMDESKERKSVPVEPAG